MGQLWLWIGIFGVIWIVPIMMLILRLATDKDEDVDQWDDDEDNYIQRNAW